MESWIKTCILLCLYGFFKEVRPSEPFLTEYLLLPQKNLTESEVYYGVFPVWTYSYLSFLVVVFLLTDVLRYKPVIVVEGLAYIVTWCLLLWGTGLRLIQLAELVYGFVTAAEVAYYTYIYAKVDGVHYQKVTSFTRTATLCGRFTSAVSSQVLYSTKLMDAYTLNYVSLTSVIIAFAISCCLPPVSRSIYFHRETVKRELKEMTVENTEEAGPPELEVAIKEGATGEISDSKLHNTSTWTIKEVGSLLWVDFISAYSNKHVIKWSIWWAFATCINFQVTNYIQPLWETIAPVSKNGAIYNGAAEAASTLLGALSALGVGYLVLNWRLVGEGILALVSLTCGILVLSIGLSGNISVAYFNYVLFRAMYEVLMTVSSFQVASDIRPDSYGLIFGINMFVALLLQTILTVIVVEVLKLEIEVQFVVCGSLLLILASLFLVLFIVTLSTVGLKYIRKNFWKSIRENSRTGGCERSSSPDPMGETNPL